MNAWLEQYLTHLAAEQRLSPYTQRNYAADLGDFLAFLEQKGISDLGSIHRQLLREYLGQLLGRGMSRGSVVRKVSAVRTFYRYLVREELLAASPLGVIPSPKKEERLPSYLGQVDVARLLAAPDTSTPLGLRDRALLELLYASGLRVSEVVGLDLAHLSLERRELRVHGKGNKERMVLMGVPAAEALERYLQDGRPNLLRDGGSAALFLNRFGERLSQRSVQTLVRKYAAQAGIDKDVHPHLLRHTFATHLLDGGADLRVVQELLGHENLGSTQIYTHVSQAQTRRQYLAAHPRARKAKQ